MPGSRPVNMFHSPALVIYILVKQRNSLPKTTQFFRLYVRLRVSRRLRMDDAFVVAVWLMNLANAILW